MIPRTFLSTYASNNQQQMAVVFLTDVTGLKRWADYIPVKLAEGGSENSYANNGYVDVVPVVKTSTMRPFAEYVPVYVDSSATDAWQVNATGYIPYGYAGFGSANMVLDFTNGSALDSRVTFTRSTTGTRTNASGLIESVAINGPRFDYNPTTLESLGLLIEESRTNLLTYSEQFDNAAWTKTNLTITANTVDAPDGAQTGDIFNDGTLTGSHSCHQAPSLTASTTYTISCFIKNVNLGFVGLGINTTSSNNYGSVEFNLVGAGSVNRTSVVGTGFAIVSSSITAVGNNWFRCVATITLGSATVADPRATIYMSDGSGSFDTRGRVSYTGTSKTIQAWGAQLEAGAFPTSYIPTVASQVTRAADVAVMTGTNFSSWYNATAGTLYVDASPQASNSVGYALFEVNDATATNRIGLFKLITTGNASMAVIVTSATQASTNNGAWTISGKLVGAYAVNDFASVLNGGTVSTDTSGTLPTVTQATIGARGDGANRLTGTIKKIAYYPLRLTNAQLQGLTS